MNNSSVRPAVLALSVLALLQAVLLLIAGHGPTRIIGVVLAIVGLNVRLRFLAILAVLIVVNFGAHLSQFTPPFPYRLAHVAILAMYAAVALAGLAALVLRTRFKPALVAAGGLALVLIGSEGLIEYRGLFKPVERPAWIGAVQPHPVLGDVNPPNGKLRVLYVDNPRGYFDENTPAPFQLDIHDRGSAATLEQLADPPGALRVRIASAADPTSSNIQLNERPLSVSAGDSYTLSFRARADSPRPIGYAVSMAHAPFKGLGLYREVAVGPDWQEFSETFVPIADDSDARVHFDLGANPASVELAHVVLRRMSSGQVVRPRSTPATQTQPSPAEYSVTFQFNGLGCRGSDVPIPRPTDRRRILVLGAGQTLGVGVHAWDTFASRLERSLNKAADQSEGDRYDVINCGANGYTPREDLLFYELIGWRYEPDVVLVSMDYGDDQEIRPGRLPATSKVEELLLTKRLFENLRRPREARRVDVGSVLESLSKLSDECRARRARLAVVVFPDGGLVSERTDLVTAVSSRLNGAEIPFLDLSPALLREHEFEDLVVHRTDSHPNELAHHIAAAEIERFLRRTTLIR